MRRVGKQIVAITLAAAMMGSLTPEACTFLQNEIVYAAETNEASARLAIPEAVIRRVPVIRGFFRNREMFNGNSKWKT